MYRFLFSFFVLFFVCVSSMAQNFTYPTESYAQGSANGNYIIAVSFLPPYYINTTGPSSFPYYNIFSNPNTFYTDSTVSIDIATGTNPGFTKYAVFVDFNMNGVFSDAGETIIPPTISNATNHLLQSFTIPSYITASTLCRMRVICTSINETINIGGNYQFGETEDYTFYAEPYGFSNYCPTGVVLSAWNNWMGNYTSTQNYFNNSQCSWLIQPTGATFIDITFEFFETQAGVDLVKVYDGSNASGTLLGTFSGTTLPPTLTATSGSMYITFTTNGSVTDNGFQALYHCYNANNCTTDLNPACNGFTHNITNVTIFNTSLNSTSTCTGSNFNYTSFPVSGNTTTSLVAGNYYILNVIVSSNVDSAKAGAWVDFNHNNNFETFEYFSFGNVLGGGAGNAVSLYVPTNAQSGLTKMRIRSKHPNGNMSASEACTVYNSGETEDYQITIGGGTVGPPAPFFSANTTDINVGGSVNFTDQSTNNPTAWVWTFQGGTPSSSTVQNPTNIVYSSAGCYQVSLTATNGFGSNTNTQACYVNVSNGSVNECNQLFFSEYLEGSSNNKALEIYNPTNLSRDLNGYAIQTYANGSTSVSSTYNISGTIDANSVYVVAHPQSSANILAVSDATNTICQFNGNDAVALAYNGNVIDVIGEIGVNPGTFWAAGSGSTLDNTLVRNQSVTNPTSSWLSSQTQWTSFASNTVSNLGTHNSSCATIVGLAQTNKELSFSIYPNPATNQLIVDNGQFKIEMLTIQNTLGEIVFYKQNCNALETIDLSGFAGGMFMVRVGAKSAKFIKQ
jgi:PKD repeat protein